ncbi:hypothetical protein MmiHf6_00330 [Methanimicrococcus hongohii]|uniref:DUF2238 domain-containing protein n=1 Tax=Methanimicrococcus hongohii TaxID=3028295 RepID=A0AA97A0Y0_9EURY|nr:hypothetical protein [Methanimicrococcus sp. Hf6]WNY22748.1 hypothetical protein MmiHf6_00330 [Methanimicrococcus sp. Hf6]
MGKKKEDHSQDSDEYAELVEPRISKYLRYFVLFVLFSSIALIAWNVFTGLEDGVTLDNILQENIYFFFFTIMTLVYMSLPGLIQRRMGFVVDPRLIVVISVFIFAGSFLGQAFSFFDRFAWWDTMLHTISGIILGLIAFALTSALNDSKKAHLDLNPFYVALFSFTFAVAGGAIWEIVEYLMDWIFGTTMQCWDEDAASYLTGNPAYQSAAIIDTMEDLMVDAIGALIVSVVGYFYLSNGRPFMRAKKMIVNEDENDSKRSSYRIAKNNKKITKQKLQTKTAGENDKNGNEGDKIEK